MFCSKALTKLFLPGFRGLSLEQSTMLFSVSVIYGNIPCFFKDTVKMIITIFLKRTFCALTVNVVIILTVFSYVYQCF